MFGDGWLRSATTLACPPRAEEEQLAPDHLADGSASPLACARGRGAADAASCAEAVRASRCRLVEATGRGVFMQNMLWGNAGAGILVRQNSTPHIEENLIYAGQAEGVRLENAGEVILD